MLNSSYHRKNPFTSFLLQKELSSEICKHHQKCMTKNCAFLQSTRIQPMKCKCKLVSRNVSSLICPVSKRPSYSLHSNVAKAPSVLSFIALVAFLVEQRRRGFWAELWTSVPCTVDTEMQKFWKERVRSTWNSDFLFLSACGSPHQHSPPVFATPHDAIQPARSICVRDIKHKIHSRIDMHNLHQL